MQLIKISSKNVFMFKEEYFLLLKTNLLKSFSYERGLLVFWQINVLLICNGMLCIKEVTKLFWKRSPLAPSCYLPPFTFAHSFSMSSKSNVSLKAVLLYLHSMHLVLDTPFSLFPPGFFKLPPFFSTHGISCFSRTTGEQCVEYLGMIRSRHKSGITLSLHPEFFSINPARQSH